MKTQNIRFDDAQLREALFQQRHQITINLDHRHVVRSGDQMAGKRSLPGTDLEHGVGARISEAFRHRFEDGFAVEEMLAEAASWLVTHERASLSASSIAATKLPMSAPPRPATSRAVP